MPYCIRDLIREGASGRGEGLPDPPDGPTDERVDDMLDLASSLIDEWTGWWFEPRSKVYVLDGPGDHRSLRFEAPIISIASVKRLDASGTEIHTYDAEDYVVYNRHLSGGSDDRRDPRIEYQQEGPYAVDAFVYSDRPLQRSRVYTWPLGQQNIKVEGRFGYTDYDGVAAEGVTPEGIVRLCRLLVLRVVWPLYSHADMAEEADRRRIVNEKTRDQSWSREFPWKDSALAHSTGIGMWTGDPEIDRLIKTFQRPMAVASI